MTGMRNSLDRLGLHSVGTEDELLVLLRRAWTEQGIAIIDIGKVRNGDWAMSSWLKGEVERQLKIGKGGTGQ